MDSAESSTPLEGVLIEYAKNEGFQSYIRTMAGGFLVIFLLSQRREKVDTNTTFEDFDHFINDEVDKDLFNHTVSQAVKKYFDGFEEKNETIRACKSFGIQYGLCLARAILTHTDLLNEFITTNNVLALANDELIYELAENTPALFGLNQHGDNVLIGFIGKDNHVLAFIPQEERAKSWWDHTLTLIEKNLHPQLLDQPVKHLTSYEDDRGMDHAQKTFAGYHVEKGAINQARNIIASKNQKPPMSQSIFLAMFDDDASDEESKLLYILTTATVVNAIYGQDIGKTVSDMCLSGDFMSKAEAQEAIPFLSSIVKDGLAVLSKDKQLSSIIATAKKGDKRATLEAFSYFTENNLWRKQFRPVVNLSSDGFYLGLESV